MAIGITGRTGMTAADFVLTYGSVEGYHVILNLPHADSLQIDHFTNLASLAAYIDLI
jgi:hypothetical protein